MGLRESTERLRSLVSAASGQQPDLAVVSEALRQRAKAIGEFAALTNAGDLQAALEAGREVRRLLLDERRILLSELQRNQMLLRALEAGQSAPGADSRTSLFG
jgi:hypothetical protein